MHSLFRLIPAVILLPFINKIADLVEKIKPDNPVDEEDSEIENNLRDLDEHLIDNPSIALAESAHLIGHMIDVAIHNYQSAKGQFRAYDQKRAERIKERELLLDRMADAANKYIIDLSPNITLDSDTRKQSFQFRALNCFERIGDYANNIGEAATALQENSLSFSTQAMAELEVVFSAIDKILEQTRTAFKYNNPDESIRIEAMEEAIDDVIDILQENHIDRMVHRQCEVLSGIHFQNVLQNLERISDMCSDMAVGLLGRYDDDIHGQEHVFIHDLHHSNDPDYIKEYRTHLNQYMAQVREITQLANSQENPQS